MASRQPRSWRMVSRPSSGCAALAKEAENKPADRAAFLQFNLERLAGQFSRDPLFDMATYDCRERLIPDFDAIWQSCRAIIGVDMSLCGDLTAVGRGLAA